jgi:hypothetical protein
VPFDDKKFYGVPTRADVAGVAINVSLALGYIAWALEAIRDGKKDELKDQIKGIRDQADTLDEIFNQLTGYTAS